MAIVNQNLIGLISSTKGPNFRFYGLIIFWNEFIIIKPQKLGSLLRKSSQSNFNLRSPSSYLARSYLIATVCPKTHLSPYLCNQPSLSMASEQDTQQRKSLYYAVYTATIALLVYTTYLRIFNCLLGNVSFTAYL